ncbi:hypothetical protein JCM21714_1429 [Gracilibacillus boraciitolerans JCM 21714]|uniref:RNA polymerase sigma-70 region 2 domain-containing protein n=1 Tax=Gracilibacillus boraciitolerans JCM 21714 TaxID=1298598 RepID=W4VGD1_9BACI|nr:sigma-70 family RNA polymerase sigma factor [Gracilibacillus boraciitolerans]GAE92430.1 hypothetical protein JCM21714_1429 [Gracilibacillus boraciitolerans JCM 21714]
MEEFASILKEHEKMIFHLINKYQIQDIEGEFYQEGMIAVWHALQTYDQTKSKLSTYVYYCITRRFLNKIKKENSEREKFQIWFDQVTMEDIQIEDQLDVDSQLLIDIQNILSLKQWQWFVLFILRDRPVKEIADNFDVTENAVKNWGKQARPKIKLLLVEKEYL